MEHDARHAPVEERDALILGGGLAGLSAAILLAREGLSVAVVDRASAVVDAADPASDLRTTALLQPAIETLTRVGVWSDVEPSATPLAAMRMIDAGGRENRARTRAEFQAQEIERRAFGANVANTALKAALLSAAAQTGGVTLIAPAFVEQLLLREDAALARLSDGRRIRARLAIGADGRDSQVRTVAGIPVYRFDYGQTAMAFVVAHETDHRNVSTEILRDGGPFTLVPHTPDPQTGRPRSSVVWMERQATAARLLALDDAAFEEAANDRSLDVLGRLSLASRRVGWPVASIIAGRFHGRRVALIAEAAHAVPPIGAQGLNMSLADAVALTEILGAAREAGRDIGEEAALERLTRARYADVAARLAATAALNGAAIGALQPIRDLRQAGLELVRRVEPLRKAAMRFGLG